MPTRGRVPLLTRTLLALAAQEGVEADDFELVVVVDGHDDPTPNAVQHLTLPFRVTTLQQVRAGVAVARNRGWRAAAADLILFLDDDIIARPRLVLEHLRAHAKHSNAVVLGRFSPDTGVRRDAWTRYDEIVQEKKYAAFARDEQPSAIRLYTGNVSIPRSLLETVGGFDKTLPRNEDVDLGFRLQEAGAGFVFAPAADGLHVGYRSFESWRSIPLVYGRLDVAMYRQRGYVGGVRTIVACFHDRHPLNRLVIRLAIRSRESEERLKDLFGWVGVTAYRLRLEAVSYMALSALWNLCYWIGVRDGLRGTRAFRAMLRETRRHRERPYELFSQA